MNTQKYQELNKGVINQYESIDDFAKKHFPKLKSTVHWSNVFGAGGGIIEAETAEQAALIRADLKDPNKGGTSYNTNVTINPEISSETRDFGYLMYRF